MIKAISVVLGDAPLDIQNLSDDTVAELYKSTVLTPTGNYKFVCPHLLKEDLKELVEADGIRNHRKVKEHLDKFCSNPTNKMLGIYGLRRTGKSVLMRAKALELLEQGRCVAYFDFENEKHSSCTFDNLLRDLEICKAVGVEYVFIDEITLIRRREVGGTGKEYFVPEFPTRGLSIYATLSRFGVHVMVAGTDSFCLSLARSDRLFGRIEFLHTTSILYSEFEALVGPTNILDYLRIGGVFPWSDDLNWALYMNTAIINNIISSIRAVHPTDKESPRFNSLFSDDKIRTLIIYTLSMSDISFLAESLDKVYGRAYTSHELGISANNLARRDPPVDISDKFRKSVEKLLANRLNLTEIDEQMRSWAKSEIEAVLCELDAVIPFALWGIHELEGIITVKRENVYALSVTGLRNYQLSRTLESIQDVVSEVIVSFEDGSAFYKNVQETSEGHLLEYLIISDTIRHLLENMYDVSQCRVRSGHESIGEIDMVVHNKLTDEVSLFEIKRSDKIDENQVKHFINPNFMDRFKLAWPNMQIKSCNVIYLGKTELNGKFVDKSTGESLNVCYINAEDYLCNIDKWI